MMVPAAADGVDERAFSTSRLADLALESLPIGVLISTADADRATAELHGIGPPPPRPPFPRKTFGRNVGPLAGRAVETSAATPVAGPPPAGAREGESPPPIRYRLR